MNNFETIDLSDTFIFMMDVDIRSINTLQKNCLSEYGTWHCFFKQKYHNTVLNTDQAFFVLYKESIISKIKMTVNTIRDGDDFITLILNFNFQIYCVISTPFELLKILTRSQICMNSRIIYNVTSCYLNKFRLYNDSW